MKQTIANLPANAYQFAIYLLPLIYSLLCLPLPIAYVSICHLSTVYLYMSSSSHLSALALFFDFEFWKYSGKSNLEGKGLTCLTIPECSASCRKVKEGNQSIWSHHTRNQEQREKQMPRSARSACFTQSRVQPMKSLFEIGLPTSINLC